MTFGAVFLGHILLDIRLAPFGVAFTVSALKVVDYSLKSLIINAAAVGCGAVELQLDITRAVKQGVNSLVAPF